MCRRVVSFRAFCAHRMESDVHHTRTHRFAAPQFVYLCYLPRKQRHRKRILPLYTGKLVATEKKTTNTDPREKTLLNAALNGRRRGEAARSQARGCSRRWAGWGPEPAPCTLGPTSFFLFVLSTGQPGQARASRCAPAPHLPACLLACAQLTQPRPTPARRPHSVAGQAL